MNDDTREGRFPKRPLRWTVRRRLGNRRSIAVIFVALALTARATDPLPVFTDDFTSSRLGSAWRARQGTWTVADGVARGQKDPASKHPAKLDLLLPQREGALQFSFKTDRPGGVDLFFYQGDIRIAVVQLRAEGLAFATYPKTKAVPSEPTYLARAAGGLRPDVWHQVRIERRGGTVRVETDSGAKLDVAGSGLGEATTSCLFILRGPPEMTLSLDRVQLSTAR